MKNKKILSIYLSLSLLVLVGCSDDYLEKEPSGANITKEQIQRASDVNPKLQAANIAGMYSTMFKPYAGGTEFHENFGQKSFDIYSDILSCDMALNQSKWNKFLIAKLASTVDYTATVPNYTAWSYYYKIINSANQVIDALGGTDKTPQFEEGKHFMGQAKAMRAYAYFYLANFYATEYNPETELVPIYTNTTVPNQPLSKTKEVFDLIVKDLTQAISLLETFDRGINKSAVNKYVAEGLLAYVYAYMGQNDKVLPLTNDIINNGGFTIVPKDEVVFMGNGEKGGFNNVNSSGWMWGADLTADSNIDLVSWWGMMDYFSYSYQAAGNYKVIDDVLFSKIKDSDVRKGQFPAGYLHMPVNKFYAPERQPMGQRTIVTDILYMRVAEFYLLKAETLQKLGMDADAVATLKQLLKERFNQASDYAYVDGLSGDALKDEISLQTRIELWGEGKSYLEMKRNKRTVSRGNNHVFLPGTSYQYNDPKLSFVIPQKEIQNNPQINK